MISMKVPIFLVALQSAFLLQQQSQVSADILSPLFSPILNGLCDHVDCGRGVCKVSDNHTFGFMCECNPGWNQFNGSKYFSFLPCVIPKCTISSSCTKNSPAPAPAPSPFEAPPGNSSSFFDPCTWSFCAGGHCRKTSNFNHQCECKLGYSNLLNISSFPCYQDCSIGGDCAELGISVSNSSSPSSSTNLNDSGNSSDGDIAAQITWLFMLSTSLVMFLMT